VQARGLTTLQLAQAIADRLRNGYVREPHVSVEVETYRPFYILGEVNAPGQYPYVANMTVETAVAIAGGFTPRGEQNAARLTRSVHGQSFLGKVPINTPVQPGDTINVAERWF
jgi:polysaccharide export outer membrane protein